MPWSAPLAEGDVPSVPFVLAGDPCACACDVWAGGFCEENLELILEIHEPLRSPPFESGGVRLPFCFSELLRLSKAGRFAGIFWGGVVAAEGGGGGEAAFFGGVSGLAICASSTRGLVGSPPCDDVLGGGSLARAGDEGACWR